MSLHRFILFLFILPAISPTLPIAVLHGFLSSCKKEHIKTFVSDVKAYINDTHIECIEIGNGYLDSMFMSLESQGKEACEKINSNPNFQGNFTVVGFSQGNLIARYLIQRCNLKGNITSYLSMHGIHMGISNVPFCPFGRFCEILTDYLSNILIRHPDLDQKFTPASFLRTRHRQKELKESNKFLLDLNNEYDEKKVEYKEKFCKLEKLMLVTSPKDIVVTPQKSEWFEYYDEDGEDIVKLNQSKFYKEDYIGLRKLNEEGKVKFVTFHEKHTHYSKEELEEYVIPFLK